MLAPRRSSGRGRGIRAQRRQILIEAASDVLLARGRTRFRIEDVADRAGMSRRTVYNYFPTVRSLVIESAAELYGDLVENLRVLPPADADIASGEAVLEDLISVIDRTDLARISAETNHVFDGLRSEAVAAGALDVVTVLSEDLSAEFARRYPGYDTVEKDVIIASVLSGLAVLLLQWSAERAGTRSARSTRQWERVQRRFVDHMRTGHRIFRSD